MADTHQHSNLLLKPFSLGPLRIAHALLELLDGEFEASSSLDAKVNGCEVPLSELLKNTVLRMEAGGISATWIPEDKSGLIEDGDLVSIFKLTPFVSSYHLLIHECTVTREVFQHGNGIAVSALVEEDAMTIGDGRHVDNQIAFRVSSHKIASCRKADEP